MLLGSDTWFRGSGFRVKRVQEKPDYLLLPTVFNTEIGLLDAPPNNNPLAGGPIYIQLYWCHSILRDGVEAVAKQSAQVS